MVSENHPLNGIFKYYFHDPNSNDWSTKSYLHLTDIKTIEDYWAMELLLKENMFKGMFFLMRNNICPTWESKDNFGGSSICFKIKDAETNKYWHQFCARLLTENLLTVKYKDDWSMINGLSISPKKDTCIIKIWIAPDNNSLKLRNEQLETDDIKTILNIPNDYNGDIVIKPNI